MNGALYSGMLWSFQGKKIPTLLSAYYPGCLCDLAGTLWVREHSEKKICLLNSQRQHMEEVGKKVSGGYMKWRFWFFNSNECTTSLINSFSSDVLSWDVSENNSIFKPYTFDLEMLLITYYKVIILLITHYKPQKLCDTDSVHSPIIYLKY